MDLQAQVVVDLGDDFLSGEVLVGEEVRVFLFDAHDHRLRERSRVKLARTRKRLSILKFWVLFEPLNVGLTGHNVLVNCKMLLLRRSGCFPEICSLH